MQKLIELLEQTKYCSIQEQAAYLTQAGLMLPVKCKECKKYEPGFIRPYCGWCSEWDTAVRETGYCHHGERRNA